MRRGRVELALGRALRAAQLEREDVVAIELARTYARAVDSGYEPLSKIGAQFTELLTQLGMTPKARAAVVGGKRPQPASGLDELRARREHPA